MFSLFRLLARSDTSPSEWTVIIWLIIVVALAAAIVTPDHNVRVLCLIIGIGTLLGRVAVNRFIG